MHRLLARLELRFGRFALPGLTYYLVALHAFVFVLELTNPGVSQWLVLDRQLVLQGQFWRLVTYLFIPQATHPMWVLFSLYWLYFSGTALEAEWGAFKYQVFWLCGMLCTTVVAFAFGVQASSFHLLLALFLAFATLWPDFEIRIFFVLPVRVKWLAVLDAIFLMSEIGQADGLARAVPLIAVGNYLLFFTPTLLERLRGTAAQARRGRAFEDFRRAVKSEAPRSRRCTMCGLTDADPQVEFRVCTCEKCGGQPTEFCLMHSRNH
jgi:membrane associated rhomboid family serine protease